MGEDTFPYNSQTRHYSNSFSVKLEERAESAGMGQYTLNNSDDCSYSKMVTAEDKGFHEDGITEYDPRPQLHHMPSVSTVCTSDSFHGSLASADSGEISAYDLNATDSQTFDWEIHNHAFQWPPNRDHPY